MHSKPFLTLTTRRLITFVASLLLAFLPLSCNSGGRDGKPYVVVYTALDEMYSKPIFEKFTKETGIEVRAVYDSEATKTTGLVSRLMAEAKSPLCDVFWNNEIVRTITLKRKGLLQPYRSPSAEKIPEKFKDPEAYWTGFAGRARILIYNKNLVPDPARIKKSIWALTDPKFRGKAAIAKPLFGTTSTHAAFLFQKEGADGADRYFSALRENEVLVVAGNATVRDMVAQGRLAIGMTDTDDANGALEDGYDVGIIFPDSERDKTLVIPNTVMLMKGAPHAEAGRKLIDFLLSVETEEALSRCRSAQIPFSRGARQGGKIPALDGIPAEEVEWEAVADHLKPAMEYTESVFLEKR